MVYYKKRRERTQKKHNKKIGKGLINSFIENVPFELHVPGYRYLGPGTKLEKKLAANVPGINKLDEAAKKHDIAYSRHKDLKNRHIADKELEYRAWEITKDKNTPLSERATAWLTTNAMKIKRKLGGSIKTSRAHNHRRHRHINRKHKLSSGKGLSFNQIVSKARQAIKGNRNKKNPDINALVNQSLAAVRKIKVKNHHHSHKSRIIPIPKTGGAIPLIPILTALSHVGSLVGGVSSIVNAIKNIKNVRDEYKTTQQQQGSGIIQGFRIGQGLTLKSHKKGFGIAIADK